MATRKKIYYPDEQIQKNLFTQGKDYMLLDGWEEHIGYYHKYSTGEVYTEKEWDPLKSKRLVRYKQGTSSYFKYLDLTQFTVFQNGDKKKISGGAQNQYYRYKSPRVVKIIPTQSELNTGILMRYFVYKRNEPERVFFEIDKKQVKDYKTTNRGINHLLYGVITIGWKTGGPEYDVYKDNILVTSGVIDTNKRIINRYSKKFPMLAKIITNYKKFSKYDTEFSNLTTGCINCK